METQDSKKTYLIELYNNYGRNYAEIVRLNDKEATIYRLKGYNVMQLEKLNGTYVRKQ